jgi:hypothetical protein
MATYFHPRAKDNRARPRVYSVNGKQNLNANVWVTTSTKVKNPNWLIWISQYIPFGALPFIGTAAITGLLMSVYYTAQSLL